MIVRPVHIDEPFAECRENVERRWRTIDELAIGSVGGKSSLEHELIFFARFQAVFFQEIFKRRAQLFCVENGFDGTIIAAAANQSAVGAFAENEIERADDNGFARTGFAGDGVESGLQFQRQVGNQRQIFDAQCR